MPTPAIGTQQAAGAAIADLELSNRAHRALLLPIIDVSRWLGVCVQTSRSVNVYRSSTLAADRVGPRQDGRLDELGLEQGLSQ